MRYPNRQIGCLCLTTEQRDPRRAPDAPFRYIDISSVDKDLKAIVQTRALLGRDAPSRARKVVHTRDVLVSTVRPNLNAVALVPSELEGQIVSTGFCVLRPNQALIDHMYLFYWTLNIEFVSYLTARMRGASYPAVTDETVKEATIPLPSLSEQRRIVALLEQADVLRKKHAEADAKADRIIPALFYKMFGDPATNPKGWREATLSEVVTDLRYGTSTKCFSEPGGFPVLRIPNILHEEVSLADLKYAELPKEEVERLLLQRGDVLFVRTNGNRDYVGRCAVFDMAEPFLFASYLIRARLLQDKADPWFVTACLRTPSGRQAMSPFIRTTAGQSNIGLEGLRQIPIPLPPITMQRQFRTHLEYLHQIRRQRRHVKDMVGANLESLLSRAFSGNLTSKWREAHMQQLLTDMKEQAKALQAKDVHNSDHQLSLYP